MRLLQLSLEPGERAALDLHPMLSVVQGLDERARERLVRTVVAVAAGSEPPCTGIAEAHGVTLPLDEANLALLDLAVDADPVVRRADIPGAAGESGADGSDSPDPIEALIRTAPEGAHPELDEVRRRHRDTREALRVLREMTDDTARQVADATDERRRLGDAVSSAAVGGADDGSDTDEVAALEADLTAVDAGIAELAGLDLQGVSVLLDAIEDPAPV